MGRIRLSEEEKEKKYAEELDLLYRLRYGRGLKVDRSQFYNDKVRDLAFRIGEAIDALEELDDELGELWARRFE